MPGSAFSDRKLKPNLSQKLVNFFLSSSSSSCFPCFSSGQSRLAFSSFLVSTSTALFGRCALRGAPRIVLPVTAVVFDTRRNQKQPMPQTAYRRERASSYRRVTFLPNDDYFEFPVLSSNDDTWMEPADHMSFSDFVQAIEGHFVNPDDTLGWRT